MYEQTSENWVLPKEVVGLCRLNKWTFQSNISQSREDVLILSFFRYLIHLMPRSMERLKKNAMSTFFYQLAQMCIFLSVKMCVQWIFVYVFSYAKFDLYLSVYFQAYIQLQTLMWLCMCICVCVCMCACKCRHLNLCTFIWGVVHTCLCIWLYVYQWLFCINLHVFSFVCLNTEKTLGLCVCKYLNICTSLGLWFVNFWQRKYNFQK